MAVEIPLYNRGESIKHDGLPAPVLDNQRRPQVDLGGMSAGIGRVMRAAEDLASASAPVLVPQSIATSQARGMDALGEGVQRIAGVLQELEQRKLEAKNYADLADAQNQMDQAYASFTKWRSQPENIGNPDSWEGEWKRQHEALSKALRSNKSYSPMVQDRLAVELQRFGGKTAIDVATDSLKAHLQRGSAAAEAKFQMAEMNGDVQGMIAAKAEQSRFNGQPPEVAAAEVMAAKDRIEKKARAQSLDNLIAQNPREAVGLFSQNDTLSEYKLEPSERESYLHKAQSVFAFRENQAVEGIKNGIARGDIVKPEDLEPWRVDISDATHAELVGVLNRSRPVNQDADWNGAFAAIKAFDVNAPDEVRAKNEAELRTQIGIRFNGAYEKELNDALTERLNAGDDAQNADVKDIADLSERMLKRGDFGPVTSVSTTLAEKKTVYEIPATVGWIWKRPGTADDAKKVEKMQPVVTLDPEKQSTAEGKRRDALRALEAWRKSQKVPPSRQQLFDHWNAITGAATSSNEVDSYLQSDPQLDNALFAFPPEEAAATLRDKMK